MADRLKFDFYKEKRNLFKKADSLLKAWQKDSLITKETSDILAITLEDIISSPDIIYAPNIEFASKEENRTPIPIITNKLLELKEALSEYSYNTPERYFTFTSKQSLFSLVENNPIKFITFSAIYNLINPNSNLYSKLDDLVAVEKSFANFSKLCEYYLPQFSKESIGKIHDDLSFNYPKHLMLSGLLTTKAISSGVPRYNSIAYRLWKNLFLVSAPWAVAYLTKEMFDSFSLIYAAPFTMNLYLGKKGIGNPFFFNDAKYHMNHSFTEFDKFGAKKFSQTPETQMMGLARLGATKFQ